MKIPCFKKAVPPNPNLFNPCDDMKKLFQRAVGIAMAVMTALVIGWQPVAAQTVGDDVDEPELTMEEALETPVVPQKANAYVKKYMKREALALHKLGYKVETMRKGEIVIVTIPTDKLFGPNSTQLLPTAAVDLKNFLPYFKVPDKFKIVLAVHSDDSGSDSYLSSLCEERIVALYDYFDTNAKNTESLVGYPIAGGDPLEENNTRAHRAANRRLEIYILPGTALISAAK